MHGRLFHLVLLQLLCGMTLGTAAAAQVAPREGDFVSREVHFASGETLPELRLHYLALGHPVRDAGGHVTNAVLLLHGTGGSGRQFLAPQFAGVLFGAGALLDTTQYYVILPDGIGHGRSSKPSDGLHARFPHYDYDDMVAAQYPPADRVFGRRPLAAFARYVDGRHYDPAPRLAAITAPLVLINSADDFINPPELGIAERGIQKVRRGRFILLPVSDQTRGHGTHTWAAVWKQYLAELLAGNSR